MCQTKVCDAIASHLEEACGPPGGRVVDSASRQVVLVLLTVHPLVDGLRRKDMTSHTWIACVQPLAGVLYYLADEAVELPADGAVEDVDRVLVHAPAQAVRGGAVVAALTPGLGHRQASLQPALVLLRRDQLGSTGRVSSPAAELRMPQGVRLLLGGVTHSSDLPLLQRAVAGVRVVPVGTGHLGLLAQHDDRAQALSS